MQYNTTYKQTIDGVMNILQWLRYELPELRAPAWSIQKFVFITFCRRFVCMIKIGPARDGFAAMKSIISSTLIKLNISTPLRIFTNSVHISLFCSRLVMLCTCSISALSSSLVSVPFPMISAYHFHQQVRFKLQTALTTVCVCVCMRVWKSKLSYHIEENQT